MSVRIGDHSEIGTRYQCDTDKTGKYNSVREYSNYLTGKYGCLTPGKNATVSITGGLLKKAMADEKTGAWLERELAKAPDYIKEAQRSAAARGATLKSVSIEFGEEYSTMTTCTVTDGGGTDSDIDKWLDRIKEKKEKQRTEEKKREEHKVEEQKLEEELYKMELKGRDMADLTQQFIMNFSPNLTELSTTSFDVRA